MDQLLEKVDGIVVVREPVIVYEPQRDIQCRLCNTGTCRICTHSRKIMYRPEHCYDHIEAKATINHVFAPNIKDVKFNDPATIVLWSDGTKTVVKCHDEIYDPEKGLAMAISKKALGNKGKYFDVFKKYTANEYNFSTSITKAFQRLSDIVKGATLSISKKESLEQPTLFDNSIEQISSDELCLFKTEEIIGRINDLLFEKDMTRKALAIEIGVSPSSVSRYLNMKTDIDIYVLSKISFVLDVELDWLLTGKTKAFSDSLVSA